MLWTLYLYELQGLKLLIITPVEIKWMMCSLFLRTLLSKRLLNLQKITAWRHSFRLLGSLMFVMFRFSILIPFEEYPTEIDSTTSFNAYLSQFNFCAPSASVMFHLVYLVYFAIALSTVILFLLTKAIINYFSWSGNEIECWNHESFLGWQQKTRRKVKWIGQQVTNFDFR